MSRTVSRAGDANSSDDGSSEEVVIDVTHRIHATRSPFVVGVIVECVFCVLMTRWMSENETHESPLDKIFVFAQERNFGNSVWIVFAVTVLGRLFCLVWSEKHILRRRSGRMVTFLYTLCGTMQWLFYLSAYYVEMDAASKLTRTHKVNLDIKEVPTFISKAAGGTELTKCLVEHDWNYKECDFDVQGTCALPYTPGTKYANGDCVSTLLVGNVQCCISETIAMATPQIKLFGQPCDVSTIFMVIKWMVVLLMGWTLRHGFLAGNIGERRFTQGAWLDVLDSVVFSEFLTSADVRYPAYGFTPAGRPQMRNLWPLASLYITWLTASLAVVLSRMIYTALVPTLDEDEQEQALPTESAMMEAGEQKDRGAQGFPVRVRLTDQESGDEKGCFTHCGSGVQLEQEGRALAKGPGSYLVTYADGSKPEVVSADRLGPLLDYMVDLQGIEEAADVKVSAECSGWLDCSELSKGNRYERFNHRAKVADALRSLLLLQLPFMLWRLHLCHSWVTLSNILHF